MNRILSVLMVDDHPMILEGYKNVLQQVKDINLKIDTANDCDSALSKFKSAVQNPYDLVFLDIKIPPCAKGKILTGEDLGAYLRQEFPSTRIIILTMFSEKLRLINILQNVNPNGFLIKSDVTPQELQAAVQTVIKGQNYYSETIKKIIERQQTKHHVLDDYDRRILYHLSKGTKTRNLVEYVPLSLGAIEKRKRKIKEVFNITSGGDREILDKARELGFL